MEALLEGIVDLLKKRFKGDLLSVVLFGSFVKEKEERYSDIDLLVVVKDLTDDWRERDDIVCGLDFDCGRAVEVVLVSLDDLIFSTDNVAPLMLEIYDKHLILYDPDNLFASSMERFKENLKKRDVKKLRKGVWRVKEIDNP
jgi:predicted nucleotidyltransferase